MTWSNPRETIARIRSYPVVTGVLVLSSRKPGNVGAKFDAWQDQFNFNAWMDAFDKIGISHEFFTSRPHDLEEVFPWDHINPG